MITFLMAAAISFPVSASTGRDAGVFGVAPVSDTMLEDARGMASPNPVLTRSMLRLATDVQARDGFRFEGTVPATQMDVWWGTIGSELIANSVRSQ